MQYFCIAFNLTYFFCGHTYAIDKNKTQRAAKCVCLIVNGGRNILFQNYLGII